MRAPCSGYCPPTALIVWSCFWRFCIISRIVGIFNFVYRLIIGIARTIDVEGSLQIIGIVRTFDRRLCINWKCRANWSGRLSINLIIYNFGVSLLIEIVRTTYSGGRRLIGIVGTIDSGDSLSIGIGRTIYFWIRSIHWNCPDHWVRRLVYK